VVASGQVVPGAGAAIKDRAGVRRGADNKTVGERLRCHEDTVGKWRRRSLKDRLDGLVEERRPGRPGSIGVDQVEEVVVPPWSPPRTM
jgi:transposase